MATIYGTSLRDIINDNNDNDTIYGYAENDLIKITYDPSDIVYAGAGDDTVEVYTGSTGGGHSISLEDGNDVVRLLGTNWSNSVSGGSGDDTLYGSSVYDILYGDAGNDIIIGGGGDDNLNGGDDNDSFVYNIGPNGFDDVNGGNGTDVLRATANNVSIGLRSVSGIESVTALNISTSTYYSNVWIRGSNYSSGDTLDFSATTFYGIAGIDAGDGNDTVIGTASADTILGGNGDDSLNGGLGADSLNGGAGIDKAIYAGANTLYNYNVVGQVREISSGVTDTLTSIEQLQFSNTLITLPTSGTAPTVPTDSNTTADSISEGAINGATVGITAFASDLESGVTYSLINNAGGRFAINSITGLITVANGSLLDFETAQSHSIAVQASDSNGGGATKAFNITLTNVIENSIWNGTAGNDIWTAISADNWTANGGDGRDTMTGSSGNDIFNGGSGIDTANGGDGNDSFYSIEIANGGNGYDRMFATGNNESLTFNGNSIEEYSTNGFTGVTIFTSGSNDNVDFSTLTLTGISKFNLGTGNDVATGTSNADFIIGDDGNDTINGGAGNDTLVGGRGQDVLSGGLGADIFDFDSLVESPVATPDTIIDFFVSQNDKIDVSTIDANTGVAGDQAFTFIGASAFTAAGQLRVDTTSTPGWTKVFVNVDSNLAPDFMIQFDDPLSLTASQFVL
jgi:Ca2+-binding RTX toxin-like protein